MQRGALCGLWDEGRTLSVGKSAPECCGRQTEISITFLQALPAAGGADFVWANEANQAAESTVWCSVSTGISSQYNGSYSMCVSYTSRQDLFESLLTNLHQVWWAAVRSTCEIWQRGCRFSRAEKRGPKQGRSEAESDPANCGQDQRCSDLLPEWAAPHSWRLQVDGCYEIYEEVAVHACCNHLPAGRPATSWKRSGPASRLAAMSVPGLTRCYTSRRFLCRAGMTCRFFACLLPRSTDKDSRSSAQGWRVTHWESKSLLGCLPRSQGTRLELDVLRRKSQCQHCFALGKG